MGVGKRRKRRITLASSEAIVSEETDKPDMDEMESIECQGCGAIGVQLYLNHEINGYPYKQVTCLPCAKKWQDNKGSW